MALRPGYFAAAYFDGDVLSKQTKATLIRIKHDLSQPDFHLVSREALI